MAKSSGATLLDLDIDDSQSSASAQLQFQEFPTTHSAVAELDVTTSIKDHTGSFHTATDSQELNAEPPEQKSGSSFWTFRYYQELFDVDTNQVLDRIKYSMLPSPQKNYLENVIKPHPDLYGPIWVCITLVFAIAVGRNLVSYIHFSEGEGGKDSSYHWKYDFHTVSYAATGIFSYAWLLPLAVWGVLWWQGGQNKIAFMELLCMYGYSLSIFIPITILWVIQLSWLQWLLLALGVGMSGSVLVLSIWPAAKASGAHLALPMALVVLAIHTLVAAAVMVFFLHASESPLSPTPNTSPVTSTAAHANVTG